MSYIELHACSAFSFLRGASFPEQLAEVASELEMPALALLAVGLIFPRGAQLYGNTFFATLLLFIGLSIELCRFKQQEGERQRVSHLNSQD